MIEVLKTRFEENMIRHPDLIWETVEKHLKNHPEALEVLKKMEETGGEPDTIGFDETKEMLIFCDCSQEIPSRRRSLCYDEEALRKRKKNPSTSAADGFFYLIRCFIVLVMNRIFWVLFSCIQTP